MARYTLSASAILLLCISFGADATFENKVYWTPSGMAKIDRSSSQRNAPGYYTNRVDTTTFSVNHNAFLTQVDLPEVFHLNADGQTESINEPYQTVVAITDGSNVWQQVVDMTPNGETQVTFSPPIHLDVDNTYQVKVNLPQDRIYAFNGEYSHQSFKVQSRLGFGQVKVQFSSFHHGQSDLQGFSPSIGMVQRIHLNRQYDEASDE